eukprot:m51a1_g9143 hypothetical protein (200) ;mRNA; r:81356-82310
MLARFAAVLLVSVGLALASDPVAVDFYVMSRCPDAAVCETAWPFDALNAISNVTLHFIGKSTASGVTCPHGASECAGDTQQLCARHLFDASASWCFVLCQDHTQGSIPRNAQTCASKCGLNWEALNECASGELGASLLRESVESCGSVRVSCSIYVDGKPRCVHDGDWQECPGGHSEADFERTVCDAYAGPKPAVCRGL